MLIAIGVVVIFVCYLGSKNDEVKRIWGDDIE